MSFTNYNRDHARWEQRLAGARTEAELAAEGSSKDEFARAMRRLAAIEAEEPQFSQYTGVSTGARGGCLASIAEGIGMLLLVAVGIPLLFFLIVEVLLS